MESAQAELIAVRQAMSTSEPVIERTAYIDWLKAACKDATDDQWIEFQASFGAMHARWQAEKRKRNLPQQPLYRVPTLVNLPSSTATSFCPSPSPDSFQPYPYQWRTPLQGDTSMWVVSLVITCHSVCNNQIHRTLSSLHINNKSSPRQ